MRTQPSPLQSFKATLVVGACFEALFSPTVIRGNLGTTVLPGGVRRRTVRAVTAHRVIFEDERGKEAVFSFPPASEIRCLGPDEFAWVPSGEGAAALTYRRVAA